jgi:two-component system CheB/CheR fusion protein
MVKDEVLQSRITEITRHIEELRKQGLDAPDKIAETLSKILDELEISLEELSAADEELCLQNEKLIDAEERFRTAIDFTYDWETWLDPDGNYIYVSPSCERITGYSADEFLRDPELIGKIVHPDDRELFPRHFHKRDEETLPVDFRIFTRRGEERWISHVCQPVFSLNGQYLGRRGSNRDITKSKRSEEELRMSQKDLGRAQAVARTGSWRLDVRHNELLWSDETYRIFGIPQGTPLTYEAFLATVHPEDQKLVDQEWTAALHGEPYDIEHRIIAEDSVKWVRETAELEFDKHGLLLGGFGTVQDITERKWIENNLRETKDYLENLIDHANAPIIVWDPSYSITRFNHAFERLTGLGAEEVLGKSLEILFPEESRDKSLEYIKKALSGERWEAVEIPILTTKGFARTVLWNSANIYDKDRKMVVATIAQGQDITERKQMEKELEQKVQERTVELFHSKEELEVANEELQSELEEHRKLEADLIEAKEAAEAAAEAKMAFLANMSHELRTPMNAVVGFTSLLLDDNLTPEQKDCVEGIRNGGEALLALINDILEFSKAEKEKVSLEYQPLRLKHCIEESLDMVAVQANQKGLNLSYTINYGTPDTIMGDPGRLRQILVNLLGNAIKFTDAGEVSVSVSSKVVEGNDRQILFAVRDTGIGIPQDKMNRLFQPFGQLERIISRKRDGVGLGLAISKKLVELMRGEIWAESVPGQGSTFCFTIRAKAIQCPSQDVEAEDTDSALESLAERKPLSILVAEDNPSNQRVLVAILKRMGYRPDAVADGKEVLQALELRPYDLILMDVRMPEMDGITATRVIRKLWPKNSPKVVAITAYAMPGDQRMCLEAGMDDYLSKPVQKKDLEAVLIKYSDFPKKSA